MKAQGNALGIGLVDGSVALRGGPKRVVFVVRSGVSFI